MALPPAFLDELRARTPMAALVGRRVKLKRAGRTWTGCCPFHNEKSPSFTVYDDGYHCFGCGAHGDAISFVMQSEGRGFREAVESLAGEAGLEVPKPTPQAAEAERQRLDLNAVLDAAQQAFTRALHASGGREALDYLRRRGLTDATIDRFGLGWAGEGRGTLPDEEPARLVEAGLMRVPVDDAGHEGAPRPLYFNRVIFPIRDRGGRLISFGGRTLGEAKPKYINGPETALFSKKRSLYALDLARIAVRQGAALIVAEGYMDVIALHQAGFEGAVAPLGTALTAEQLEELWRQSPAPVLCFDGDVAGVRAASRAAELALPVLTPERTLRIATLPSGQDPDSLLRAQGPAAVRATIEGAVPLAEALYGLLREGVGTTPEARAAFLARLDEAAGRIADRRLAGEYRQAWRNRYYADRPRSNARPGKPGPARIVRVALQDPARERARIVTAILVRHPALLADLGEAFSTLDLPGPYDRLRDALLGFAERTLPLDSAGAIAHVEAAGLAQEVADLLSASPTPLPGCASAGAMPAEAEAGWYHFFGLINRPHLEDDFTSAAKNLADRFDNANMMRSTALAEARRTLVDMGGDDA